MDIQTSRIQVVKHFSHQPGKYVLYWMQQAQRTEYNHALEYAQRQANLLNLPLLVCFVITPDFPEANVRHYTFMCEGLRDVAMSLDERGIGFVLCCGDVVDEVLRLAGDADLLVADVGYLRIQRQWRAQIAQHASCKYVLVESDVVVPVGQASHKAEVGARTLRPRIHKHLADYLVPLDTTPCQFPFQEFPQLPCGNHDPFLVLKKLDVDTSAGPVNVVRGGQQAAHRRLKRFIEHQLAEYHLSANDPTQDVRSGLSAYLHFGQISPVEVALRVLQSNVPQDAQDSFLEQLLVRRELAMNFVWHTRNYDVYEDVVPQWAQKTLADHADDERSTLYDYEQFAAAQTHDAYWNAAQNELLKTGSMHNYMRMYWGKKIIEWSPSPRHAYTTMLRLNNTYQLDGRDPNSFAGVAWCFGTHDRAWAERAIFGKVRYMNAQGLQRKFAIEKYAERWRG